MFAANPSWMKVNQARERTLTVGRTLQHCGGGDVVVPMIRLRGRWLVSAGFATGDLVALRVRGGEIRITPVCRRARSAT